MGSVELGQLLPRTISESVAHRQKSVAILPKKLHLMEKILRKMFYSFLHTICRSIPTT